MVMLMVVLMVMLMVVLMVMLMVVLMVMLMVVLMVMLMEMRHLLNGARQGVDALHDLHYLLAA